MSLNEIGGGASALMGKIEARKEFRTYPGAPARRNPNRVWMDASPADTLTPAVNQHRTTGGASPSRPSASGPRSPISSPLRAIRASLAQCNSGRGFGLAPFFGDA